MVMPDGFLLRPSRFLAVSLVLARGEAVRRGGDLSDPGRDKSRLFWGGSGKWPCAALHQAGEAEEAEEAVEAVEAEAGEEPAELRCGKAQAQKCAVSGRGAGGGGGKRGGGGGVELSLYAHGAEGGPGASSAEAKEPPKASKPRGSKRKEAKEAKEAKASDAKRAKGTAEAIRALVRSVFFVWKCFFGAL